MKVKFIDWIISAGKYNEPIYKIRKRCYWTESIPYKYYVRFLGKEYPITGKEFSTLNGILQKIKKGVNE